MGKFIDLTGQRFGKLLVIEKTKKPENAKSHDRYWRCLCDCGNEKIVRERPLKNGNNQSCGCTIRKMNRERTTDLAGQKFGRWTVIKFSHTIFYEKTSKSYWFCKCDCGTEKPVYGGSLKNGKSKSCGCLQKEIIADIFTKDLTGLRFYKLLVLEKTDKRTKCGSIYWKCLCDCGKIVLRSSRSLIQKETLSCGCHTIDSRRKEPGIANFNTVYDCYKRSAKKRNLVFELSKDFFKNLTQQNCHYCGCEPNTFSKKSKNGIFIYNGIDRLNSFDGYIENNVVPCCKKCNEAKNKLNKSDFLLWIKKVYTYSIKNKEENIMTKAEEFAQETINKLKEDNDYNDKWNLATKEQKEYAYQYYVNWYESNIQNLLDSSIKDFNNFLKDL